MFGYFGHIPNEHELFDVVIVGAGAAGIVLAQRLAASKLRVALLEAGGEKRNGKSQEFYRGRVEDTKTHPELHRYRVRALGGSTQIWGGRTIPFDEIDFARRDWVPESGWPIGYKDLHDYYVAGTRLAEAGNYQFSPSGALPGHAAELAAGLDDESIVTTIERFSRPTDFWKLMEDDFRKSENISVFANSAATRIRLKDDAGSVDYIEVASPDGKESKRIRGRHFVISMGGLETTRLLLASNDVMTGGIGSSCGWLGRNYISHLCQTVGKLTFTRPPKDVAYDYERDQDGIYLRRRWWITPEAQARHGILNTTFRTHLPDPGDPSHGNSILSAMFLVKDLVLYEYGRKFADGSGQGNRYLKHVANIVRDPLKLALFGRMWLRKRVFADRKLPSVVLGSSSNSYMVEFHAEQAPNWESHVLLGSDVDKFGVPRLDVRWRPNTVDLESIQKAYGLLAGQLKERQVGKLEYDPAVLEERARHAGIVGGHHIGTTRMSDDPKAGVVDRNCKVHGVGNLYIASASTFPTSGQANPTLTILALALRLGDHIAGNMTRAAAPVPEIAGMDIR